MKGLKITESPVGSVVILRLEGDIKLGEGNLELHKTLKRLVDQGEKRVVLDLAGVANIDSSGLGELIAGSATLNKNGGELKLLHLTDRVRELMTLTKLLTVFESYDAETEVIESFGADPTDTTAVNNNAITGKLDAAAAASDRGLQ